MNNILAGHTNSYHTYTLDEALAGIAQAGFKYVELSAVRGWTEQISLDAGEAELDEVRAKLAHYDLTPSALSGHSDLTTAAGVPLGMQAIDLCEKLGIGLMNTAIGGHYSEDEDRDAFMGFIHELADYAAARGITIGLEVHGEIMANGARSLPVIEEINRPNVGINYDTANCIFYGDTQPLDDLALTVPHLVHVHLKDKIGGRVSGISRPSVKARSTSLRSWPSSTRRATAVRPAWRSSSPANPGRPWPRSTGR